MAMNHNSSNQTTASSELRCTLCSGHFPSRQAFNCHMVRRVVNLTPHVMTRVIHYPILPPSPISSDDSSDSDSMASLGSDSTESGSGSGSTVSGPPPPVEAAEEEIRPRQRTLNLLGDWEPLADLFAKEAAAVRAANGPIQAPLDLELSLKYAPAATLDLDLKLGL